MQEIAYDVDCVACIYPSIHPSCAHLECLDRFEIVKTLPIHTLARCRLPSTTNRCRTRHNLQPLLRTAARSCCSKLDIRICLAAELRLLKIDDIFGRISWINMALAHNTLSACINFRLESFRAYSYSVMLYYTYISTRGYLLRRGFPYCF